MDSPVRSYQQRVTQAPKAEEVVEEGYLGSFRDGIAKVGQSLTARFSKWRESTYNTVNLPGVAIMSNDAQPQQLPRNIVFGSGQAPTPPPQFGYAADPLPAQTSSEIPASFLTRSDQAIASLTAASPATRAEVAQRNSERNVNLSRFGDLFATENLGTAPEPITEDAKNLRRVPRIEMQFDPAPACPPNPGGINSLQNGVWEGERLGGVPHGEGTLRNEDGMTYIGQFAEGHKHGKGSITYPNGDVYIGDFERDMVHGEGRYTWADGEYYDGVFNKGKRDAYGTMSYSSNGKPGDRYEGFWRNGYREGRGKMTYGQKYFYDGKRTNESFDRYVGEFKEGKRHGKGHYTFKDGSSFEGEYREGFRHGMGIFQFKPKADGPASALHNCYISEWEMGVEKPGCGVHTVTKRKERKAK